MRLEPDDPLVAVALAHVLLGVACLAILPIDLPPLVDGSHRALKPMKFGFSIGVFLASSSLLLRTLDLDPTGKRVPSLVLAGTMTVEMGAVVLQAIRGRASHFNVATAQDAAIWRLMVGAIVVATAAMLVIAITATVRPLRDDRGASLDPLLSTAWRMGVWSFGLAAFSGFTMGGRMRHDVGGSDDVVSVGPLGWSVNLGDLRVAHFVGLHALQLLPLTAWALLRLPITAPARWGLLGLTAALHAALGLGATLRALEGRAT
jgi:hypothetical protein